MKYVWAAAALSVGCGSANGGENERKAVAASGPVLFQLHGDEIGDIEARGRTDVDVYQADDLTSIEGAVFESHSESGETQVGVYVKVPTTPDSIDLTGSYSLATGLGNDNQVAIVIDGVHHTSELGTLELSQSGQEVRGTFEAVVFDFESDGPRIQIRGELSGPWLYSCWIHTTPEQSGIVEASSPLWTLDQHGDSEFCQSLPR